MAESGLRYDDLVLHDATPVGYRTHGRQEHAVFDVLDIFEASKFFSRFEANLTAPERSDLEALKALCAKAGIACEDLSESIRFICKACSQGACTSITMPRTATKRGDPSACRLRGQVGHGG